MSLPSTATVVPVLRRVLAGHRNGAPPRDLYGEVARQLRLTAGDLAEKVADKKRSRWHIRVEAARQRLVELGQLSNETRGVWKLTPTGKRAAEEATSMEPDADTADRDALRSLLRAKDVSATTREQLILARVGQGQFRELLLGRDATCRLCGFDEQSLLVASHIKPWYRASNRERLDPYNGVLLCPNSDRLFDLGHITFDGDGRVRVSHTLSKKGQALLCSSTSPDFSAKQRSYLAYHRKHVFRG